MQQIWERVLEKIRVLAIAANMYFYGETQVFQPVRFIQEGVYSLENGLELRFRVPVDKGDEVKFPELRVPLQYVSDCCPAGFF